MTICLVPPPHLRFKCSEGRYKTDVKKQSSEIKGDSRQKKTFACYYFCSIG